MPDIRQTTYDYNKELADTGIKNIPEVPPVDLGTTVGGLEQPAQNGSLLDRALSQTQISIGVNNPWLSSVRANKPINTRLKDTLRYTDKELGFDPLNPNLEYQYGENQGFLTQWKNNLLKAGANVLGSFVDTIATIPEITNAISSGDVSKVFDNDVNTGITEWLDGLENELPNYQSFYEKEHPIMSYINPAYYGNSWGGVVKNLGFLGGAVVGSILQDVAVGFVTDGLGEVPLVASQVTKALGKLGNILSDGAKGVQGFDEAVKATKNVEKAVNTLYQTKKITDKTRYGLSLLTSSMSNGAFMAQQTYNSTYNQLKDDFFKKHGYDADGDDLKQIESYATKAGNAELVGSVALSSITHAIVLPTVLRPLGAARSFLQKSIGLGAKIGLKEGSLDVFESAVKQSKGIKGFLFNRLTSSGLKSSLTTAADLNAQLIVQRSAEDFYKRKFDDKSISDTDNMFKSLSQGFNEIMMSRQGLDTTMLGLVTGALTNAGRAIYDRFRGLPKQSAQTQAVLSMLNSNTLTGLFQDHYGEGITAMDIQNKMKDAIANDDVFEYQNLKFQQLFDFVHSGVKSNRFDLRIDQLEALKNLNDGDFKKMFGLESTEDARKTANEYVDNVMEKASNIKKNIDKVETIFKNPHNQKTNALDYHSFEEYKKQLAIDLSEMEDNRRRMSSLASEIKEFAPTLDVNKAVNLTSKEGVEDTVKEFKKRISELDKNIKELENDPLGHTILDPIQKRKYEREKKFLEDKVENLQYNMKSFDPDNYIKEVESSMNYYANNRDVDAKPVVAPIDVLSIFNRSADIYKLGENARQAMDNYHSLTNKKGFNEYIRRYKAKVKEQEDKIKFDFNGDFVSTTEPEPINDVQKQVKDQEKVIEGVEKIDENGNPVSKPIAKDTLENEYNNVVNTGKVSDPNKEALVSDLANKIKHGKPLTDKEQVVREALKDDIEKNLKESKTKEQAKVSKRTKEAAAKMGITNPDDIEDVDLDSVVDKESPEKTATPVKGKKQPKPYSIYQNINPFNFLNKIFSVNRPDGEKEQTNLKDVIFSLSPQQINEKASITINESTLGKAPTEYTNISGTKLYRRGYNLDAELIVDGKVVGKLQPSDSLYFKRGDEYVPLQQITKSEYESVTGNKEKTYDDFVSDYNAYDKIYKTLSEAFKNGKKVFGPEELNTMFDLVPNYGGRSNVTSEKGATPISQINHNTSSDIILSVPMIYDKDAKDFSRTTSPNVLNFDTLTQEQKVELTNFLNDNIDTIRGLNSRYVYLKRLPNGKLSNISIIAARPARADVSTLDSVLRIIKGYGAGKVLEDRDIKRINAQLKDAIYIADSNNIKGAKTKMFFSIDKDNNTYFNIVNSAREYNKRLKFTQDDLKNVNNFEGLIDTVNNRIGQIENVDMDLSRLNLQLNKEDFKRGILEDEKVPVNQLMDNLTLATTPDVFENYSLAVVPKGQPSRMTKVAPKEPSTTATTPKPKVGYVTMADVPKDDKGYILTYKIDDAFKDFKPGDRVEYYAGGKVREGVYQEKGIRDKNGNLAGRLAILNEPGGYIRKIAVRGPRTEKTGTETSEAPKTTVKVKATPKPKETTEEAPVPKNPLAEKLLAVPKLPDMYEMMSLNDPTGEGILNFVYQQATGRDESGNVVYKDTAATRAELEKVIPKELVQEIIDYKEGANAVDVSKIPFVETEKKTPAKPKVEPKAAEQEKAPEDYVRRQPNEQKLHVYSWPGSLSALEAKPYEQLQYKQDGYGRIFILVDPDIKDKRPDVLPKIANEIKNEKIGVIADLRGLNEAEINQQLEQFKQDNLEKQRKAEEEKAKKEVETDYPKNPTEDWMKPAKGDEDYGQKRAIQQAILGGKYVEAVENGDMTWQQAVNLIKSGGMAPSKALLELKPSEEARPESEPVKAKNEQTEEPSQDQLTPDVIPTDPNLKYKEGDEVLYNGNKIKILMADTMESGRSYYTLSDGKIVPAEELEARQQKEAEDAQVAKPTDTAVVATVIADAEKTVPEKSADNAVFDYVGLQGVLGRLMEKYGIPYKIIGDDVPWTARIKNGTIEVNINKYSNDTPFHEYYHPFIEIMKVDNPTLYKNISSEFRNMDAGKAEIERVKGLYKDLNEQEIEDEALASYMGRAAASHFEQVKNEKGESVVQKKESSLENFAMNLYNKFKNWFLGLWKKNNTVKVSELPDNASLQDVIDISSLHDVKFNLSANAKLINGMEKYQLDPESDFARFTKGLERKLRVLQDTASKRVPSPVLSDEVRAIKAILRDSDEVDSVNNYIRQGVDALDFANREFTRMTRRIAAGNLSKEDISALNNDLRVVKNLVSFYNDVNGLFGQIIQGLDGDDYKRMSEVLRKNEELKNGKIKSISINLVNEWLYPFVEDLKDKASESALKFLPSKDEFKKLLYQANGDVDGLFYLLGAVGSSTDPLSAVFSNVLKDTVNDVITTDVKEAQELLSEYDKFLKDKGLPNEEKPTIQHYKDNYLRKASVLERVGINEDGSSKYDYVDRWAFHQEFLHDAFDKEKTEFIKSIGEQPDIQDTDAYQEWTDKVFDWYANNTQVVNGETVPVDRFRNPKFDALYGKDKFFTKMYNTYNEANEKLGANGLKYGMVPQVSKGKSAFSDLKWDKGIKGNLKVIGNSIRETYEYVPDYKTVKTDDNAEINFAKELLNLDGSTYKSIKNAYTRTLDEDDLDLTLPESINKFNSSSNMYDALKAIEPNIETLRSVVEGNTKLGIEARKVGKVTPDKKTILERLFGFQMSKKDRLSRVNKQLIEFIDHTVYGESKVEEYLKIGKFNLSLNKLGDNLGFLTALNNMAGNLNAGIVNVTIGNIQSLGEAVGGKYTTKRGWASAQKEYTANIPTFFQDAVSIKKSPITQLAVHYDAIMGEFRDNYGKKVVGNFAQRYMNTDTLFFLSHGGEHQIQITGMLAMLNGQKVPLKDGTTISLKDAWVTDKAGNIKLRDDADWSKQDDLNFMRRLQSINKRLNGNYSEFDKTVAQKRWYGKLSMLYRKYLYEAFRARYSKDRYDYELQDVTGGYYRKFFGKLASDIKQYKFEAARKFFTREGWNPEEKYAYNKTMYELSIVAGSAMMGIMIGLGEDKKQNKSWVLQELYLQLLKINNDMGQYTVLGIPDMVRIMKNPTAVLNTLNNYYNFFSQLVTNPFETYKKKTGHYEAGESKLKATFFRALPVMRQVINFMTPENQIQYYQFTKRTPKVPQAPTFK